MASLTRVNGKYWVLHMSKDGHLPKWSIKDQFLKKVGLINQDDQQILADLFAVNNGVTLMIKWFCTVCKRRKPQITR